MMAASTGFATPIGYQTNLMVYGPGGYRFSDYLRIGLPLNALLAVVTLLIAPRVWPFGSDARSLIAVIFPPSPSVSERALA